jgi:glutathione synthase
VKVGFAVNKIETEEPVYTTTRLGQALTNKGHEAWTLGVGDLAYDPDESIRARAVRPSKTRYTTPQAYLRDLQSKKARTERITVDDLDVLMLRNDPSTEAIGGG